VHASAAVQQLPKLQQGRHAPVANDIAYGVVQFSNPQGARIELLSHGGITGYMPRDYNPNASFVRMDMGSQREQQQQHRNSRVLSRWQHTQAGMRDPRDSEDAVVLPRGHSRAFKIVAAPPGRPPLLSAVDYDKAIILKRMHQLMEMSQQDHQTFTARVIGYNPGGLILTLLGYGQAFMPLSCIALRGKGRAAMKMQWTSESIERHLLGQAMEVAVTAVSFEKETVVVSERAARELHAKRVLVAGHMLEGTVKAVVRRGVVVQLTAVSHEALLPSERISQQIVPEPHVQGSFTPGERIVSLLLKPEERQLRLSTLELEQQPGDMLSSELRAKRFQAMERYVVG